MPWVKGQSGNPTGRKKGHKDKHVKIREEILSAFHELGGLEYVKKCAAIDPIATLKVIGSLLPKEAETEVYGKIILGWEE